MKSCLGQCTERAEGLLKTKFTAELDLDEEKCKA